MNLLYWKSPQGNFGDDMNQWFWDEALPNWSDWRPDVTLLGIGSLISDKFDLPNGKIIVAGAGGGYGSFPSQETTQNWDIRCVRGPMSAAALGLPTSAAVTDTAAMIARMPRFADRMPTGRPLFVPHWLTASSPDHEWDRICMRAGLDYLSPCGDSEAVIRRIGRASVVLAESLHAAIVADALRVPWRPLRTKSRGFNLFKWEDWTRSMGVRLEVLDVFSPIARVRRLLGRGGDQPSSAVRKVGHSKKGRIGERSMSGGLKGWVQSEVAVRSLRKAAQLSPFLSDDRTLEARLDRFDTIMHEIARDYRS